MQPGWCQPVRQEFMENECEALPGVAYPGVRDHSSTVNTQTEYDDMMNICFFTSMAQMLSSGKPWTSYLAQCGVKGVI